MTLDELTDDQRSDRQTVVDTLVPKGWLPTDVHLNVENGEWEEYEASLEHATDSTTLLFEMHAEDDSYELAIRTPQGELPLIIYPRGELQALLNVVVEHQDTVNSDTFRAFAAAILDVCPEVLVDSEDGEPQPLKPAS
jgi:hypothetical protein